MSARSIELGAEDVNGSGSSSAGGSSPRVETGWTNGMPAVPRGEGSARHSHLTRVGRGEHAVALLLVVGLPVLAMQPEAAADVGSVVQSPISRGS
jgi:hypothetical protein